MPERIHHSVGKSKISIHSTLLAKQQTEQPVNAPKSQSPEPKSKFNLNQISRSFSNLPSKPSVKISPKLSNRNFSTQEKLETKPQNSETAIPKFSPSTPVEPQPKSSSSIHLNKIAPPRSFTTPLVQPKIKVSITSLNRLQRINTATQSKARFIKQNIRRSLQIYPRQSILKAPLIQPKVLSRSLVSDPGKDRYSSIGNEQGKRNLQNLPAPINRSMVINKSLTKSHIQRNETNSDESKAIVLPTITIIGDPKFYSRSERGNKYYAQNPPEPGWPYREDLKKIWNQGQFDDFTDAIVDFQINVMGIPENSKGADGILGKNTTSALISNLAERDSLPDSTTSPPEDKSISKPIEGESTKNLESEKTASPTTLQSSAPNEIARVEAILQPVKALYEQYKPLDWSSRQTYTGLTKIDKKIAATRWMIELPDWADRIENKINQLNNDLSNTKDKRTKKLIERRKRILQRELRTHRKKLNIARKEQEKDSQKSQKWSENLKQLQTKRVEQKPQKATQTVLEKYQKIKPERVKIEKQLVEAIGEARKQIENLTVPALKSKAYQQLNLYTPFHYQLENADILYDDDPAGSRTCNITVLAMVLQGLGKKNHDYNGGSFDRKKMQRIAQFYQSKLEDKGGTTDTSSLSLPDFLQLVVVYHYLKGDGTDKEAIKTARDEAAANIIQISLLKQLLADFGAKIEDKYHKSAQTLSVFGKVTRGAKNRSKHGKNPRDTEKQKKIGQYFADFGRNATVIAQILARLTNNLSVGMDLIEAKALIDNEAAKVEDIIKLFPRGKKDKQDRYYQQKITKPVRKALLKIQQQIPRFDSSNASQLTESQINKLKKVLNQVVKSLSKMDEVKNLAAYQASISHEEMQKLLSVESYHSGFLKEVTDALNSGHQVVVNLYNHYVRLQSIENDGFTIDDPGTYKGNAVKVTWAEAIADAYFRKYIIVKP